ncbi:YibE/F family protein [uncultured Lacticaseibacillus sp.]|uniref:YibE/F family protein n=1 Tax=uncultured Lacticaseibacillus sp. TaxID=2775882 RepID=UPI00338E6A06
MNGMLLLIVTLLVLLVAVGGRRGLSIFMSLLLNTLVLFISVVLMAGGFSPVWVAAIAGMLILAATIFLTNSNMDVAGPAFVAAIIVMLGMLALVFVVVVHSHAAGFGAEDSEDLEGLEVTIGIRFQQIMMAASLLSTLGAIAEAAIAVSAGINELDVERDHEGIVQMGREIIGTAINTLFFGFFGGFAGLFVWFTQLKYPLWEVFNNKIFVAELLTVLFSVIAVILTVPVTTWVVGHRARAGREQKG